MVSFTSWEVSILFSFTQAHVVRSFLISFYGTMGMTNFLKLCLMILNIWCECEGSNEFSSSSHTIKKVDGCLSLVDHVRNFLLITITCLDGTRREDASSHDTSDRATSSSIKSFSSRFLSRGAMSEHNFQIPHFLRYSSSRYYAKSIANSITNSCTDMSKVPSCRLEWHGAIKLRIVPSIIEFA